MIRTIEALPLRAELVDPFIIANARLDHVDNIVVRVALDDGAVGFGEIGVLPPITTETADDARTVVEAAKIELIGRDPVGAEIPERLHALAPRFASSRAGIEMACWDARARSLGVPLWRCFGDHCTQVVTDITLPITSPERAQQLAAHWKERGFQILKVKVGKNIDEDILRIAAIAQGYPSAQLVLDANEGYTVRDTLRAVEASRAHGLEVILLEQPVPRTDLDALAQLTREAGTLVCADEACQSPADAERLGREKRASAVNIKLAKCGVRGALRIIEIARQYEMATMIGAMVESRIGTGFSAHLAAGLGGFTVIDLDTSLLMRTDPVQGGTLLDGPRWRVETAVAGHDGAY